MTVLELAQKYYPVLWDIGRIEALTTAGKLSAEEYKSITGKAYNAGKDRKV